MKIFDKARSRTNIRRCTVGIAVRAAACIMLILACASSVSAVSRAEMLDALYDALAYPPAPEMKLPPDVPLDHARAKRIGHAARFGFISSIEPFSPDEELNRHDAVRLTLQMMGWGHELSLVDSLASLPDFGGSGDDIFFLAAEMKPAPPENILVDGATPLSETARAALCEWARECAKSVRWNRVYRYAGTELILYRQGVAMPGATNLPGEASPIASGANEPMFVAAVAVDPAAVDTRIAFAEPFARDRVLPSDFSSSYDAIAAVNGGYFSGARPIGTMLLDGTHAGRPIMGRGAIGWNNDSGTVVFGRGGARIGVRAGSAFTEVGRFNVPPGPDEASLYTTAITRSTVGTAQDATYVVAIGGRVIETRTGGDIWLPEGAVALVARGRAAAAFARTNVGDAFTIEDEWETKSFSSCRDLIQGGPMLLRGGDAVSEDEGFKPDITEKRHPRTIVGTDGRRVIWAVIDGRSSLHSRGASIAETAWIARSLGMTTALNLDGGGSSQILWRGVLANAPSDGRERPLPYALVMLPRGSEMKWHAPAREAEFGTWGWGSDDGGASYIDVYRGDGAATETEQGSSNDDFLKLYEEMINKNKNK